MEQYKNIRRCSLINELQSRRVKDLVCPSCRQSPWLLALSLLGWPAQKLAKSHLTEYQSAHSSTVPAVLLLSGAQQAPCPCRKTVRPLEDCYTRTRKEMERADLI